MVQGTVTVAKKLFHVFFFLKTFVLTNVERFEQYIVSPDCLL
jgi:hypothetical protein